MRTSLTSRRFQREGGCLKAIALKVMRLMSKVDAGPAREPVESTKLLMMLAAGIL